MAKCKNNPRYFEEFIEMFNTVLNVLLQTALCDLLHALHGAFYFHYAALQE